MPPVAPRSTLDGLLVAQNGCLSCSRPHVRVMSQLSHETKAIACLVKTPLAITSVCAQRSLLRAGFKHPIFGGVYMAQSALRVAIYARVSTAEQSNDRQIADLAAR